MNTFNAFKISKWIGLAVCLWAASIMAPDSFGADPALTPSSPALTPSKPAKDRLADLFGDPIVARGKGFEIKRSQLDAEVLRTKEALAVGQRPAPPDVDRQVLDGMITLKLLLAQATDADRAKAREQFDKQFKSFKSERKITDEEFNEKLAPQLKLQGQTRAEWEQQQVDQLTIPIVIQRELNAPLTEEQARKFYDENVSSFEHPETLRLIHVLISTHDPTDTAPNLAQKRELPEDQKKAKRKLAEDIVQRARKGEDMHKLAQDYSDDIDVKQNKGEIQIARDGYAPEEFKAAAFALKNTNQISDVVTSVLGYHVIQLLERISARKEPFAGLDTKTVIAKPDGSRITIRDALNEQTIRKELPGLVKKLKQEGNVEILEPKLRAEEAPAADTVPIK